MRVLNDVSLANWHTLASDSKARHLLIIEQLDDLKHVNADDIIIGSGSNIVFLDTVDARLVHMALKGIEYKIVDDDRTLVRVMAGENWHQFVALMVAKGLGGLENLALIPGTVGAAPVQNIGAYGVEVSDCIHSVEVYDRHSGRTHTLSRQECGFAYRQSHFKTKWVDSYAIVSVTFLLSHQPQLKLNYAGLIDYSPPLQSIQDVFEAVVEIRKKKLPDPEQLPNAGSFFHNPIITAKKYNELADQYPTMPSYAVNEENVKIPAAWLIEACGFKGYCDGKVGVYEKHALVLVNYCGKGGDIKRFADNIIANVAEKFGITLTIEPRIIGT